MPSFVLLGRWYLVRVRYNCVLCPLSGVVGTLVLHPMLRVLRVIRLAVIAHPRIASVGCCRFPL